MIVSPNMSLVEWNSPTDVFSHSNLANNFYLIDLHDHSSGKGVQVGTTGIQANAITAPLLGAGAVGSAAIGTGAVGTAQLATAAVTASKIGAAAVGASQLNLPWLNYTPTWATASGTQPAIGNGILAGHYIQVGQLCFFAIVFLAGSSTTWGSGTNNTYTWSPPSDALYGGSLCLATYFDTTHTYPATTANQNGNLVVFPTKGGTGGSLNVLSLNTTNITQGAGTSISIQGFVGTA